MIDITSRASISSETFMVPISAAIPDPTDAVRIRAVMKGPISRQRAVPMMREIEDFRPNSCSSTPIACCSKLWRQPMPMVLSEVAPARLV